MSTYSKTSNVPVVHVPVNDEKHMSRELQHPPQVIIISDIYSNIVKYTRIKFTVTWMIHKKCVKTNVKIREGDLVI